MGAWPAPGKGNGEHYGIRKMHLPKDEKLIVPPATSQEWHLIRAMATQNLLRRVGFWNK